MAGLYDAPPLGVLAAFNTARQQSQGEGMGQLQQLGALQGILAHAREQQMAEQLRGALSESGGDPEKAMAAALKSGNVAAAHSLAPVVTAYQTAQTRKMLSGLTPEQLQDPEMLRRLGASGMPGTAHFTSEADRMQKLREGAALMEEMKGQQTPVDRQTVQGPAPGPGVDASLLQAMGGRPAGSPPMSITVSPDGTPDPTLNPSVRHGGIFDALTQSAVPEIAAEAATLKKRLESAPANNPAAAAFFQARQKQLADKEIALTNRMGPPTEKIPVGYRKNADGNIERIPVVGGAPANDDALTNDAWFTIINGKARPGSLPIGRDEGNRYREQLREKTAEIAKEIGLTPQQLATIGPENKSKFVALNAIEKDLAAIRPFDEMLNTNVKIAVDLAKKIAGDRTNSQLLNKPITWLEQNAADNPDIAEYLFQIQTVKTEGARILNNPRLVGQLTDSARAEMGNVINGNMPLGQTERVLQRMVSDGKNRVNAIVNERDHLISAIRGSAGVKEPYTPPAPSTVSTPAAQGWNDAKELRYQELLKKRNAAQ